MRAASGVAVLLLALLAGLLLIEVVTYGMFASAGGGFWPGQVRGLTFALFLLAVTGGLVWLARRLLR